MAKLGANRYSFSISKLGEANECNVELTRANTRIRLCFPKQREKEHSKTIIDDSWEHRGRAYLA